jgi:serine protease Do
MTRTNSKPWLRAVGVSMTLAATGVCADLPSAISKVKPSVVVVGTYKATNSPRFTLRGTGFVAADGNLVVTNAHVLPEAAQMDSETRIAVQVRTGQADLQMRLATVLEIDKPHDLALLKIDGPEIPKVALRDSDAVLEGQAVGFMGFPIGGVLGFAAVTHRGSISSRTNISLPPANTNQLDARTLRSLREGNFEIFQLDATAYPGNSGGPMFDAETGEVLGVINMVFIKGTRESALTNPSGISYAIPSKFVMQLLQRRK